MLVAGVDYSGAKNVPNETWLVTGEIESLGFYVRTVKNTGSHGLAKELESLKEVQTCGLDFPFCFPIEFLKFLAKKLEREDFEDWQQVAEALVFMDFEKLQAWVAEYGISPLRYTDSKSLRTAKSPLHHVNPNMVPMTFQGMRFLATLNPDKYTILPFQDRKGKKTCTLIEVYPREILYILGLPDQGYKSKDKKNAEKAHQLRRDILDGLINLREKGGKKFEDCPRLHVDNSLKGMLIASDHAIDALVACYAAALFHSKPELFPDPLDSDNLNVLIEGWIYGPQKLTTNAASNELTWKTK